MSKMQYDQFGDDLVVPTDLITEDGIDFDSLVDFVQADGVGHTKKRVGDATLDAALSVIALMDETPKWVINSITSYIRSGLNRSYSRTDAAGILVYPSVNDDNERKGRDFMTYGEYQYVIHGLLSQSEALEQQARKLMAERDAKYGRDG